MNVLTIQDQVWNEIFRGYWGDLEIVYAYALCTEKSFFDSEDQIIINDALKNLKNN